MLTLDVTARPSDLPDFERPPVVEVALSVQFEPLALQPKHVAILWESCRTEFPQWEDQAPIGPAFELFGPGNVDARTFFVNAPPRRAIFRNAAGTELKQYQADRFVRNWTKAPLAPTYPRYESVRSPFANDLRALIEFAGRQSLGAIAPNQCEVTYVNLIPLADGAADTVAAVLSAWDGSFSDSFLPEPESTDIAAHFVMTEAGQREPVGRLHVSAGVVIFRDAHTRALQLTLTARGQPLSSGVDGVLSFLDLGRRYIVKGFASFTRPEMHKIWGRRDAS